MKIGTAANNPHAYLARFGGITSDRFWVRWAISHGALVDTQKRQPHISEFVDNESLALAEKIGVRVAHHGTRLNERRQ